MSRFMDMACTSAMKSCLLQKHGSVLVLGKKQIFSGYNHLSSSNSSVTIHAEEHAINNFLAWCQVRQYTDDFIRRKLNKAVLVTIRLKDDTIKYSPPCQLCINLIKKCGIKKVLYSDYSDSVGNSCMVSKKVRDLQNLYITSGYRYLARAQLPSVDIAYAKPQIGDIPRSGLSPQRGIPRSGLSPPRGIFQDAN